jgi:hypothetical protein
MRILIMLNTRADSQAGVSQEHDGLIEAYYLFSDAGVEIVLAAPGGGSVSESSGIAPRRDDMSATQAFRRYHADRRARDVMNDLLDLANVCAEDFDAALYLSPQVFDSSAGGKDDAGVLVHQLLAAAKPVAMIGERRACIAEAGSGLLMIGHSSESLRLAATALLGAAIHRRMLRRV